MYSIVLMAAVVSGPDTTAFGGGVGCIGCSGYGYGGCTSGYGCGYAYPMPAYGCCGYSYGGCCGYSAYAYGCCGSCHGKLFHGGLFHHKSCHGCCGYASPAYSCFGSCYGSCYGGYAGCSGCTGTYFYPSYSYGWTNSLAVPAGLTR